MDPLKRCDDPKPWEDPKTCANVENATIQR